MRQLVSIITINLNNAIGLQKTIDSVFGQTYVDYEYLIIDGGSSDESLQIIEQYTERINYWVSEPDKGIYHAMNKGIGRATGQYCLFLNSGDCLVTEKVLEQCFVKEQMADLLIGGCHVSKAGRIIHTSKPTSELTLQSFYEATIPHQATFIRRVLFDQLGSYNESYLIHGDYEFWIRAIITHYCSITAVNCVVAEYNLEGLSNSPVFHEQSRQEIHQILGKAFPKRVLDDYAYWRLKTDELHIWEWVKTQKFLYNSIHFIYGQAVALVMLKKKLMSDGH